MDMNTKGKRSGKERNRKKKRREKFEKKTEKRTEKEMIENVKFCKFCKTSCITLCPIDHYWNTNETREDAREDNDHDFGDRVAWTSAKDPLILKNGRSISGIEYYDYKEKLKLDRHYSKKKRKRKTKKLYSIYQLDQRYYQFV